MGTGSFSNPVCEESAIGSAPTARNVKAWATGPGEADLGGSRAEGAELDIAGMIDSFPRSCRAFSAFVVRKTKPGPVAQAFAFRAVGAECYRF